MKKKGINNMKTIRHGELVLLPLETADMTGADQKTDYIASHSETGHHHVIQGDCMVLERDGKDTLIELEDDRKIVHKKPMDKHASITVKKGIYRLLKKQEYDPFGKVMREVRD